VSGETLMLIALSLLQATHYRQGMQPPEVQVLCLLVYAPELQHIAYSIQLLLCLLMERFAQKSKDVCELV